MKNKNVCPCCGAKLKYTLQRGYICIKCDWTEG